MTNISWSKDNQAMNFGCEKHFPWKIIHKIKWRNYSQTLFQKIKIKHISRRTVQNFKHFAFIAWKAINYQNILILSCRPLAFNSYKTFSKNKKRSGTSGHVSFLLLYSIIWQNVIAWSPFLHGILVNTCIQDKKDENENRHFS